MRDAILLRMNLQVFGTAKCQETRKLERFLKERRISYQSIDLADKGISPGELRSVAAAVGKEALLDEGGKRFKDAGLAYMEYDAEEKALADPLLLKTPILRDGKRVMNGGAQKDWATFLDAALP